MTSAYGADVYLHIVDGLHVSDMYSANNEGPVNRIVRAVRCFGCDQIIEEVKVMELPRTIMVGSECVYVYFYSGDYPYSNNEVVVSKGGESWIGMRPDQATPERLQRAAVAATIL